MLNDLPLNISAKEVTEFIQDMSNDVNYIPTNNEIANIISLFLVIHVVNSLVCWFCKYLYWLTIAMLIWLVYLDNEVEHD